MVVEQDAAYFGDRSAIQRGSIRQGCADIEPLVDLTDSGILALDAGYLYVANGSTSTPRVVRYKLP